jgi:hypothetical protein
LGVRFFPGVLALSYLAFTVLVFVIGPWPWPVSDPWKLYTFLLFAHLAFFGGYWRGIVAKPIVYKSTFSPQTLLWLSIGVNLLLFFPTLYLRAGSTTSLYEAIRHPSVAYSEANNNFSESSTSLRVIEFIRFIMGPALGVFFPLCVFYWRRLSTSLRILSVAAVACHFIMWISMGKNKGIIEYGIMLPCLLFAAHQKYRQRLHIQKVTRAVLMTGVILVFLIIVFAWFTGTRNENDERYWDSGAQIHAYELKNVPKGIEGTLLLGASYLSQGYYALSLCLDEPFVCTYGVGNAPWMAVVADRILGINTLEVSSYPDRIEDTGWIASQRFHTIYSWLASDVSFYGVVLVMFLIGRVFGLVWVDCLSADNPLAVGLLGFLIVMIGYFPANNQIMMFPEQCSGFLGVLGLWGINRLKWNRVCSLR